MQWTAGFSDLPGVVEYSWSVTTPDGVTSLVQDFDPSPTLTYMPLQDGDYTVIVNAKTSTAIGTQASASQVYSAAPLSTGPTPVITPTANPFVIIYSAPCSVGTMRVAFAPVGQATKVGSSPKNCYPGRNVNTLVGGLISNTAYTFQHTVAVGFSLQNGPVLTYTTGPLPGNFDFRPRATSGTTTAPDQLLLFSFIAVSGIQTAVAYDVNANPAWYYVPAPGQFPLLYRPLKGGNMLIGPTPTTLREIDLLGNTVHQTTVARVVEELSAKGIPYPKINGL